VVSEIDESFGVFVRADAKPGGDGTRVRPFATIADGVSMVGGLDCSVAKWALGNARSRIESPSSPAITASSIASTKRFERFDVAAPDGTADARSSIGLFAADAAALTIAKSRIAAGDAADGADGVEPPPTIVTGDPNGKAGMTMREYCWWTSDKACWNSYGFEGEPGGAGGSAVCNGIAAYAGGGGGSGGVWESVLLPGQTIRSWSPKNGLTSTEGGFSRGVDLGIGLSGESATASGAWSRKGFRTGDGSPGTGGSNGPSGAGGSGFTPSTSADNKYYWYGSHGSGGGAGGCGGLAGKAGEGGGRGTFGSLPTPRGIGGPIIDGVASTKGENGGPGRRAGTSGSGAGGSSVALVHFGAKPGIENTKLVVGNAGKGVALLANGITAIAASASGEAHETIGF
jgi:hypothetical protein